jgi:hypothetical protein
VVLLDIRTPLWHILYYMGKEINMVSPEVHSLFLMTVLASTVCIYSFLTTRILHAPPG